VAGPNTVGQLHSAEPPSIKPTPDVDGMPWFGAPGSESRWILGQDSRLCNHIPQRFHTSRAERWLVTPLIRVSRGPFPAVAWSRASISRDHGQVSGGIGAAEGSLSQHVSTSAVSG
jgi:hypothetical protein